MDYISYIRSKVGHDKVILTFAGGILADDEGRVLLQLRGDKKTWSIPGGSVEEDELPREGAVREAMEEVNQKVQLSSILHEDSCYDDTKGVVFTRLVYKANLLEYREIKLDPEEHTAFRWIRVLSDMKGEKTVPYLKDILK